VRREANVLEPAAFRGSSEGPKFAGPRLRTFRQDSESRAAMGMRDFVIIDPTGVLWRVGQNIG